MINLQGLKKKNNIKDKSRRYQLSELISESYKALFECEENPRLKRLIQTHIEDVRKNPKELDNLSENLNIIKDLVLLGESIQYEEELEEEEETCECDKKPVVLRREKTFECDKKPVVRKEETSLDEECELTEEEVNALTDYLKELRGKNKVVKEAKKFKVYKENSKNVDESNKEFKVYKGETQLKEEAEPKWSRYHIVNPEGETIDSYTDRKDAEDWVNQLYKDGDFKKGELNIVDSQKKNESKSYNQLNLSEFNKKSSSKAFVKTFKKLDSKLHEGIALTRQESISLYKAVNSAMTHLSVELEHNPEFLSTFKESVSLLSVDANKLVNSLKEGKGPSKKTLKSLAKFSEALLREEDEIEDTPIEEEDDEFISDEEGTLISEEEEEFDQEYADAREELHNELEEKYEDTEDPAVQEKLAQDAQEVAQLKGEDIVEEDSEEESPEEEEEPEEVEEKKEEIDFEDDGEVTDDEIEELKKYLREMRRDKLAKC